MTKGKIKWYNELKGFGFIETDKGEDIFVHRSEITSSYKMVQPGDDVQFDIKLGDKGLVAKQVSQAF